MHSRRRSRRDAFPLTARSLALAACVEGALFGAAWFLVEVRAGTPRSVLLRSEPREAAWDEVHPAIDHEPGELRERAIAPPLPEPPLGEMPASRGEVSFDDVLVPEAVESAAPPYPRYRHEDWLRQLRRRPAEPARAPSERGPAVERDARIALPQPLEGCNEPPPYPARAIRLRQQGKVVLLLAVDGTGHVTGIDVHQSSGFALLDLVAKKTLAGWRFSGGPARVPWTIVFRLAGGTGQVQSGLRAPR